jgi:FkbM family methyltransferase
MTFKQAAGDLMGRSAAGRRVLGMARDYWRYKRAQEMARAKGLRLQNGGDHYAFSDGHRTLRVAPAHLNYYQTIVEQFHTYVDAVEGNVVDFSTPRWFTLKQSRKEIYLNSFSEGDALAELYLAHSGLAEGGVALDIGANCGMISVFLAERVKSGTVVALEPDPANYAALLKNAQRHGGNIRPVNAAIWKEEGAVSFRADGTMGAAISNRGHISVPAITLMSAARGLPRIDFVKMDVEGAEMEVIPYATEFLRSFPARWVIEVHDKIRGLDILSRVFTECGYEVTVLAKDPAPLMACRPRQLQP